MSQAGGNEAAQVWHICALMPTLRRMPPEQVRAVAFECDEHSQREPLHLAEGERFALPSLSEEWTATCPINFLTVPGKRYTGQQVIAALTCCIWLMVGESEERGGALLATFPALREALPLTAKGDGHARTG